jgi:hypothetical protein
VVRLKTRTDNVGEVALVNVPDDGVNEAVRFCIPVLAGFHAHVAVKVEPEPVALTAKQLGIRLLPTRNLTFPAAFIETERFTLIPL